MKLKIGKLYRVKQQCWAATTEVPLSRPVTLHKGEIVMVISGPREVRVPDGFDTHDLGTFMGIEMLHKERILMFRWWTKAGAGPYNYFERVE